MTRRRDDGLLVEPGSGSEVEILDPVAAPSSTEADDSDTLGPTKNPWPSIWPAFGAVLVAGLAILTLSVAGNTPAPEPPAPSVTTPRNELSETERRRLEAAYGVRVGDGPGLMWEPVDWEIDSTDFQWIDDGFVADDGITEWTIRPGLMGPNIGQRQSLLVTYPNYRLLPAQGARVLAPREQPIDHLLVFGFGDGPVRLELPVPDEPLTDLLRSELFIDIAVIDATAVALIGQFSTMDSEALSLRLGREMGDIDFVEILGDELYLFRDGSRESMSLDGITLSETELELLQNPLVLAEPNPEIVRFDLTTGAVETIPVSFDMSSGELQRVGDRFVLEWADDLAANNRSMSFSGQSWSTKRGTEDPYTVVGDESHLYGLSPGELRITRSIDGGSTWRRTTNPLRNGTFLVVDDVIVLRDSGGRAVRGEDPLAAFDAAGVLTTTLIAMTRWKDGEADPAWRIEEATDMFGSDVASLDFVAGEGHVLAVVGTSNGPQFYLVATRPPLN